MRSVIVWEVAAEAPHPGTETVGVVVSFTRTRAPNCAEPLVKSANRRESFTAIFRTDLNETGRFDPTRRPVAMMFSLAGRSV